MQPGLKSSNQGAFVFEHSTTSLHAVFASITVTLGRVHRPPFIGGETEAQSGNSIAPAIQLDKEDLHEE